MPALSLPVVDFYYDYLSMGLSAMDVPFVSAMKHAKSDDVRHVLVYSMSSGMWQHVGSTDAYTTPFSFEGNKLVLDGETPYVLTTS